MELTRGMVAVVTGGASGLGLGLATQFADRGLSVVIGDVEKSALDAAVSSFEADGVEVLGVHTDVRHADEVDALAAATLERFGKVDIICNNAGVCTMSGCTWEIPYEDWEWVVGVNLNGVFNGVRSFVPHLVAQGSGYVVNTASMGGISIGPSMAPYEASKHGVVALSLGLRDELDAVAPGIGVTIVCPGMMDTRLGDSERNRPPELQRPASPLDASRVGNFVEWVTGISQPGAIQPIDAAAVVIAAMEADELFAYPHSDTAGSQPWLDRIQAQFPKP
jgi:NAD(P)-dependent dehydrogenase (short-subunit alcohol dehydrogenase family)